MDQRRKHRRVLRTSFTKLANEIESLFSVEEIDSNRIKVCMEMLQQKYEELLVVESEIYDSLLSDNAEEDVLLAEIDASDSYKRTFSGIKLRCKNLEESTAQAGIDDDRLSAVTSTSAARSDGAVSLSGKRKFKLPAIQFKKFDGNIREWLSFWAQFKKIDEDQDIDDNDKIEYLIQATVPDSRARQLVESFPAMGENYTKIVEGLKSRFGREDLQIEVYIRELLKLILNNAVSKDKMDLSMLYDKIETQLRSLETLGITSNKCSAMLFPLIESCLPEELIRVWQRTSAVTGVSANAEQVNTNETTLEHRLNHLMSFLENEVKNEQRISLAAEGFGITCKERGLSADATKKKKYQSADSRVATAADLLNRDVAKCIFCNGTHNSASCFKAQKFSYDKKKNILASQGACFKCLKVGHLSKKCNARLKCVLCGKPHVVLVCPKLIIHNTDETDASAKSEPISEDRSLANNTCHTHVFLQTLILHLTGSRGSRIVRALIDTGSQRTYILKSTARQLGYISKRTENLRHCLFGGSETEQKHDCYDLRVNQDGQFYRFEALGQEKICSDIPPLFSGPWTEELKKLDFHISDVGGATPIELLIGADIAGKLYTGKTHPLSCGLTAMQTIFGWTLMGKVQGPRNDVAMTVLSLFVNDASITDLWSLDILGITDPTDKHSRQEMAVAAKELFLQTVTHDEEGRYEVRLPWLVGHPQLPNNYILAQKRLATTLKKLKAENLTGDYDAIFNEWLKEGIIEEVTNSSVKLDSHYLPHRPVIKESSATTKIRPVFDACAREKGNPSLNQCLEKGLNLIEQIPSILLRFRENKIGVVSDIRKAFLQISIHEADRDYLRFLWINSENNEIVYRHRRVVFGVTCSPFLLGATIEYHLSEILRNDLSCDSYSKGTVEKLLNSFYVDNCVTSVKDEVAAERFISESRALMAKAMFDLRGWEYTRLQGEPTPDVPVLGLIWRPVQDILIINEQCVRQISEMMNNVVTKRLILSAANKVFDPIGFTCPSMLCPKLLLQEAWKKHIGWDTAVDEEMECAFRKWIQELPHLLQIEIPRWMGAGTESIESASLHIFCDASKQAYTAVVFIRVVLGGTVFVRLLAAKARVAPLKNVSIPRLELLGATIAARLYSSVQENLEKQLPCFFWSDSSTVLSWIRREEEWAIFVGNRVMEIRKLTKVESWRHIPGTLNPADLPSRGCSPKYLLKSRWWEGPQWLYESPDSWPRENYDCDEEEVSKEKRKKLVTTLLTTDNDEWHLTYFSQYTKIVRMIGWIFRFVANLKSGVTKDKGPLTADEFNHAELFVFQSIQRDYFQSVNDPKLHTLDAFYDNQGIIRLKSRICHREDDTDFRFPIILPSKHSVVEKLIYEKHVRSCHVGVQGLMSLLRENYWILGGRRSIKSVVSRCVVCRRHNAKPFSVVTPPLPLERVRDAVAFEVIGVDFAGPLYLKSGEKVWICLFTCAVYRAIHVELTSSLSTLSFMHVLRRFVARRGRPKFIYSDNGRNFVGAENAFSGLDWDSIVEQSTIQRIKWRFNPPTAAWWGGFWERLIGVLKALLRKILGRASLNYEKLLTLLCECESIVNARPLTYMSDDSKELIALTPAMFLRDQPESGLPDCDAVDRSSLCRRVRHILTLRKHLRHRFRNEYLGQLKSWGKKQCRTIRLGEIVLIGNDNDKRLDWPMGRVVELLPGTDGQVHLVRVKTANGQLLRPVQRLFPLECSDVEVGEQLTKKPQEDQASTKECGFSGNGFQSRAPDRIAVKKCGSDKSRAPDKVKFTRFGREIKLPKKLLD